MILRYGASPAWKNRVFGLRFGCWWTRLQGVISSLFDINLFVFLDNDLAVIANTPHQRVTRFCSESCMRPGIPSCATKPVATYAAAAPQSHLPAASAGA